MAGERPKALLTGPLPGPDTEPQPAEPRRTDARRMRLGTESFSGSEGPAATWWGRPHGPQEGRPPCPQGEGQGPIRKKANERYSGPKPMKAPPETPDRGPLATTTGLGCASTVSVAGKSHTRKKAVVAGAGTRRRRQGAVGSQPGPRGCCPHTGTPTHGPSSCHPPACRAPSGACRVKTRTRSSRSLCQNLESRAPGGERAAGTGERALPDTPFLSLTVSYVAWM